MDSNPSLSTDLHDSSMLAKRFGKEVINYFSGSPLNRVSFLREDHKFLSEALNHPSTSFLVFNNLQPLMELYGKIQYLQYADVEGVIGSDPYTDSIPRMIATYDSRKTIPLIIFLGLNNEPSPETGAKTDDSFSYKDRYYGKPYFAVDITPMGSYKDRAEDLIANLESRDYYFSTERIPHKLDRDQAAIFAQSRHVIDWNKRNKFCAQCGQRTLSINGGFKRACPAQDLANPDAEKRECQTRTSISNISFPRTDPTMIAAIVSADGTKMLIGRNKRAPPDWYSTLAGFIEPAESVEEAVRREVWEESGVRVGRVVIHSTQPWPFPANLMIGAIGQALPGGEEIHLGHDKELLDAKWVSLEEIKRSLDHDSCLRLPRRTAIANRLMTAVVHGFVGGRRKL